MQRLGVAAVAVLVLSAARADAQFDHYIGAGTGGGCDTAGETTEDIHDDFAEGSCGSGVGGVDPNWFEYQASANSASGHLNVTGQVGVTAPPASFNPNNHDSTAFIREKLTPTAPGPIQATLQVSAGIDVPGAVVRYEASLSLTDGCSAFVSQIVGNGFVDPPTLVTNCPAYLGSATADLDTLTVTLDDPGTTIEHLGANLRAEWFSFGSYPPTAGEYVVDADLRVDPLEGADYIAGSPNFLTQVPEPEEPLLGVAALAALGVAKRRRG